MASRRSGGDGDGGSTEITKATVIVMVGTMVGAMVGAMMMVVGRIEVALPRA